MRGAQHAGGATPAEGAIVDDWFIEETGDGLLVVGRADGRHRAVRYDPERGPRPVLVPELQVAALEAVNGSRVPTPARDRVQELHQQHAERVDAIREGGGTQEAITDGDD